MMAMIRSSQEKITPSVCTVCTPVIKVVIRFCCLANEVTRKKKEKGITRLETSVFAF